MPAFALESHYPRLPPPDSKFPIVQLRFKGPLEISEVWNAAPQQYSSRNSSRIVRLHACNVPSELI